MKVKVTVTRRRDIADPQGTAVARGLHDLGYDEVTGVRIDKVITLDVDGSSPDAIQSRVAAMCEKLLANPVMEDYQIDIDQRP